LTPPDKQDRWRRYVAAAVAALTEQLEQAAQGERNRTLFRAARRLAELEDGPGEAEILACLTPPASNVGLGNHEIKRTVASGIKWGRRRRQGPDSLPDDRRYRGTRPPLRRAAPLPPAPEPPKAPPIPPALLRGLLAAEDTARPLDAPPDTLRGWYAPRKEEPQGARWERSWEDFARALACPAAPADTPKEQLPLWNLATFREDKRNLDNLEALHGLALDLDNLAADTTPDTLRAAFGRWAFLAHTSPSHTPEAPRWRVFLPLAQPVGPEAADLLCRRWAPRYCAEALRPGPACNPDGTPKAILDSLSPAQGMFMPKQGPHYLSLVNPGPALRAGEALAELAAKEEQEAQEAEKAPPAIDLESMRVGSFMGEAFERLERRENGKEKPIPLPWPSLADRMGGGLWPGLTILVGNTGSGKSQLALQAALHAAAGGTPVLYIGLELDRLSLVARLLGLLGGVWWSDLYLGKQPQIRGGGGKTSLGNLIGAHWDELGRLPFHLTFCPPMGWSYGELFPLCKAMRERYPETDGPGSRPFLVVLDFLQIVAGEQPGEALRERIGRAAYAGRAAARDLEASVILISSTARENYGALSGEKERTENGRRIKVSPAWMGAPDRLVGLGKESGEIEFAADHVLTMVRDEGNRSLVHIAAAKGRAGGSGWALVSFDGAAFGEASLAEHAAVGAALENARKPPEQVPEGTKKRKGEKAASAAKEEQQRKEAIQRKIDALR
jgi:hypothetical protein